MTQSDTQKLVFVVVALRIHDKIPINLFKYLVTVLAVIGFYTCVTDQSMGKKALALLVNLGEEIKRNNNHQKMMRLCDYSLKSYLSAVLAFILFFLCVNFLVTI